MNIVKDGCIYVIFIVLLLATSSLFGATKAISLCPISDKIPLTSMADRDLIRRQIIHELLSSYDCVMLTRSHGAAVLREQRLLAQQFLVDHYLDYPPTADYWIAVEIIRIDGFPAIRMTWLPITGKSNGEVRDITLQFSELEHLNRTAVIECTKALAEVLDLQKREETTTEKAINGAWAVLPFCNANEPFSTNSRIEQYEDWTRNYLQNVSPEVEAVDGGASTDQLYYGASELTAAAIGGEAGADYVITGYYYTKEAKMHLILSVIRVVDAVILYSDEASAATGEGLDAATKEVLKKLVLNVPYTDRLPPTTEEKRIEESKLWQQYEGRFFRAPEAYQAVDILFGASMIGQDTYMETAALGRLSKVVTTDDSWWWFHHDWEKVRLSSEEKIANDWVIPVMEAVIKRYHEQPWLRVELARCYARNGQRSEALAILKACMAEGVFNPNKNSFHAQFYIRALTLNRKYEEADAFYQSLDLEVAQYKVSEFAAYLYRLTGDESKELEAINNFLKSNYSHNFWYLNYRFNLLLRKHATPEEQLNGLSKLAPKFRSSLPARCVEVLALHALGKSEKASKLATALINEGGDLPSLDFNSKESIKAAIAKLADEGGSYDWPEAKTLQKVPDSMRMYLQPVGEFDTEILQQAAEAAGDFFGCEFIVRAAIPPPTDAGAFYHEKRYFYGVPLLRRLISAAPPPKDAINQVYLVERLFVVIGRAHSGDLYRIGLGTVLSYDAYQRTAREEIVRKLSYDLIRQFRYFVERPNGIPYEEAPDAALCINSSHRSANLRRGYCSACAENYTNADMNKVFNYVQSLPTPVGFQEEPYYKRFKLDEEEMDAIQTYVEQVSPFLDDY